MPSITPRFVLVAALTLMSTACKVTSPYATSYYNIYGTISGQTGSTTIQLWVNGQLVDALTAGTSITSFEFANDVQTNDTYQVVVSTPPSGQECDVTALASGTVAGNISGVTIYCTAWLYEHNTLRHQLNSGALTLSLSNVLAPSTPEADLIWDPALAAVAQTYASTCPTTANASRVTQYEADGGTVTTSDGTTISVGENDAWGTSTSSLQSAFASWQSEDSSFVYGTIGGTGSSTSTTGHFTQLIWANTTHVGCGEAHGCAGTYSSVYVCNYAPAGNVSGAYPYTIP